MLDGLRCPRCPGYFLEKREVTLKQYHYCRNCRAWWLFEDLGVE